MLENGESTSNKRGLRVLWTAASLAVADILNFLTKSRVVILGSDFVDFFLHDIRVINVTHELFQFFVFAPLLDHDWGVVFEDC